MWEDTDVLRTQLQEAEAAKAKLEANSYKQMMGGCGSHDRSAERAVVDMAHEDRVADMAKFMREGNEYFNEGQYARAVLKYKRSLIYFEYCFCDTDEQEMVVDNIRR
jgi:hypothetical protein